MGRKMTFLEYLEAEEAKGNELTASSVINLNNHEFGNDSIEDRMLEDWLEHESEELHAIETNSNYWSQWNHIVVIVPPYI